MSDGASTDSSEDVFRLIYRSRDRISYDGRRAELGALFSTARSNNKKLQITGALLLTDDWFVQTLEGEEQAVRGLFDRIEKDPRHDSVTLIDTRTVTGRVFSRWAMAMVAEDGEPDIPLIAHTKGISPAAGKRTTPEQDELLDLMRGAARGESHSV